VWPAARKPRAGAQAPAPSTPRSDAAAPASTPVDGAAVARSPEIRAIESVIQKFLVGYRVDRRGNLGRLAASRNLWREVSSLTLLELVAFVEQKFAIKVRPIDFAPQNFSSVSTIAQFVVRRRDAGP
jgi:hypothetical protein